MVTFFLKIYDFLQKHHRLCMGLIVAAIGVLFVMMTSLRYNENINDFLPLKGNEQKAISLYQDISGSQRVYVLFQMKDSNVVNSDRLSQAVDSFSNALLKGNGRKHIKELTSQVDFDKISSVSNFIYSNIPVMLTEDDYAEMEKRLSSPDYVDEQLSNDVQMMMMPAMGVFNNNISNDPLSLFSPVMERLTSKQRSLPFEIDNGYIFTQGRKTAIAMITTPYGAVESANNALLMEYVDSVKGATMRSLSDVNIEMTGAPVIAVDNAKQIKKDSFLAITISVTLILALLVFSFRSFKDLLLIGFAILFGWVFAMGCIAFASADVSLIVLGIGSIIIGIAVNYPLHFIAHTAHGGSVRDVLKDMVSPLLIGNITTVGAFAALVPLDAPALHDLGLFAAFMLIGTILFVLIFLPHLVKSKTNVGEERLSFGRLAAKSPEHHKWILPVILLLTVVFGYYSLQTSFDANMHNINYMTPVQKRLLSGLQSSAGISDTSNVYIVAEAKTWDEALATREQMAQTLDRLKSSGAVESYSDVSNFVCSRAEQERRIERWNSFWAKHRERVASEIERLSPHYGFTVDAFSGFFDILQKEYTAKPTDYFEPITSTLLPNSFNANGGVCSVVDVLQVPQKNIESVKTVLNESLDGNGYAFDFVGMNSALANSLSDNFNYIGFACSVIVFVFLWLSFGRIELSLLAFLPMALGWIWILGFMQVLEMQFNIVNIILATFIFGQGDDYTIFMTDGLINEYAYKRKLLPSYKNSIVISALIMFIGIGSLIVAKHPALHSLAEVTIVGMFTVVLMAWLIPPLIFRWIVCNEKGYRHVPVTLEQAWRTSFSTVIYLFELCYGCILGFLIKHFCGGKQACEKWYHEVICKTMRFDINHIHGIKAVIRNEIGEDFSRGSIMICNHQSILDPIYLLSLSPNVLIIVGAKVWRNPIVHTMFRYARFINVNQPIGELKETLRQAVADGYNVVIFPEALRSSDGQIKRFHKGAFYIAQEIGADILPVLIHGTGHVMPKGSGFASRGQVTLEVGERIPATALSGLGKTHQEMAHNVHEMAVNRYEQLKRTVEDSHYYHHAVLYRYIYKGIAIERETKRLLKRYDDFSKWVDFEGDELPIQCQSNRSVAVINAGKGQFSLMFALVHSDVEVFSYILDKDDAALAMSCQHIPKNLKTIKCETLDEAIDTIKQGEEAPMKTYLLFPDEGMKAKSASLEPEIVE